MSRMIPSAGPRDCAELSREDVVYYALAGMPDDFTVVHSCLFASTAEGVLRENEADFIVFHPQLGIICIEVKAGGAYCKGGEWFYASGRPMKEGGPYRQADTVKWRVIHRFRELGLSSELASCKVLHAVWFVTIHEGDLRSIDFPPEASLDITLSFDDLKDPEAKIRSIFALDVAHVTTELTPMQADKVVQKVLCPEFDIVPTSRMKYDIADIAFAQLLDSQTRVLNYIEDQRVAVINGAAGTGKTLIAVEYAKRCADKGESVLLLCFNALLKDDLTRRCADYAGITVRTIAGYACSECRTSEPDYDHLAECLLETLENGSFPYQHVVIDEGQDFGIASIDNSGVLDLLRDAALSNPKGTFYVFYDRRQFVQGSAMPSFIGNADCKLTLYVNCRNTESIATCSMRSLGDEKPCDVRKGIRASGPPLFFASLSESRLERFIDGQLDELRHDGIDDIVILSCKTLRSTLFAQCIKEDAHGKTLWKNTKVPFVTCRRFKGLEADAVVLVDVDASVWKIPSNPYDPDPGLIFYTGASRAKYELRIACSMGEQDCEFVLERLGVQGKRKPISRLAKRLNAVDVSA